MFQGTVIARPEKDRMNPKMLIGDIEMQIRDQQVLNRARQYNPMNEIEGRFHKTPLTVKLS